MIEYYLFWVYYFSMNKYDLVKKIENFAPLETQEPWDCSGWLIDRNDVVDIKKVMLALTPSNDVINQALQNKCDFIISHHPLFFVDCSLWKNFSPNIDIYCAHTNFDKANGGTTDTIIDLLGLSNCKLQVCHEFLRVIDFHTTIDDFNKLIAKNFENSRLINNSNVKSLKRIAFCAGSGADFIEDCKKIGADCLVTGDIKYHTAVESDIVLYDIGHFQSEIISLKVFENLLKSSVDIVFAEEVDPFKLIR